MWRPYVMLVYTMFQRGHRGCGDTVVVTYNSVSMLIVYNVLQRGHILCLCC